MENRKWTGKTRLLAAGCAAVLLAAGFLSGIGLKKCFPARPEVSVYSVEGLRDKKWSDAVAVSATAQSGFLTAYYYDSRKPAAELYVTKGQSVSAGTPLFCYGCQVLEEELARVEQSLDNQRIYLEQLGGFIGNLKAVKPVPDGLGRSGAGSPERVLCTSFVENTCVFLLSPGDSLEGLVEGGGEETPPVVYGRIDETAVPSGGSGTAQDPYVYYVKKGGEILPEVTAVLVRLKLSARFVVVEGENSLQTPLFSWIFDGKIYEEKVQGEAGTEEETDPVIPTEPESSAEESGGAEEPSESETNILESSEPENSEPETSRPEESSRFPEESSLDSEENPSRPGEDSSETDGETATPDFEEDFDDEALDDALSGLESEPQGYTKEELARVIRERSLEYENLELAIRKKEQQAESLQKEIEENVLVAEADGRVQTVLEPKEAARLGQPVLTVQGTEGIRLCGWFHEELAAALKPGDLFSVSARAGKKEVSFEAVLQSVDTAPEMEETGTFTGEDGGNPAMSYYGFVAALVDGTGIREGDIVDILIPRSLFQKETAGSRGERSLVLPDSLLFYEGGQAFVYAMDPGGFLTKRKVETGRSFEGTKTEILEGIGEEDYLAYPEEAAGLEGAKARMVYGEEMEIGTEPSGE